MWIAISGLLGMIAVMAGAFGAHWLEPRVAPKLLETWKTAASYQLIHAVVLAAIAFAAAERASRLLRAARLFFLVGILCFSGSLFAYVLSEFKPLVFVTPLGGVALQVAWLLLAFHGFAAYANRKALAREIPS